MLNVWPWTGSTSEVPLTLRTRIDELAAEGDGWTFTDGVTFVGSQSAEVPDTCPDCGAELIVTAVYRDPNASLVAVQLTCLVMHNRTRIATSIYDPETDDLYLELEELQMGIGDWRCKHSTRSAAPVFESVR